MRTILRVAAAAAMSLGAAAVGAKVSAEEAARLGRDLTPVGAIQAANKDGSIPAWEGGLTKAPSCYEGAGSRYCDPFPEDKPLFTITAKNLDQYKAQLTPGQLALFDKYGDSYVMPVYKTRRTFANPQFVYDATAKNAVSAELGGNGEALQGAITGIPFPIPANGHEVIWNHKVRYRDTGVRRWNNQFAVTTSGNYNLVKIQEDAYFVYNTPGIDPSTAPSNHSPKFMLDESSLDLGLRALLQVTLDYLHGPPQG